MVVPPLIASESHGPAVSRDRTGPAGPHGDFVATLLTVLNRGPETGVLCETPVFHADDGEMIAYTEPPAETVSELSVARTAGDSSEDPGPETREDRPPRTDQEAPPERTPPAAGSPDRVPWPVGPPGVGVGPPESPPPGIPPHASSVLSEVFSGVDPGHGRVVPRAAAGPTVPVGHLVREAAGTDPEAPSRTERAQVPETKPEFTPVDEKPAAVRVQAAVGRSEPVPNPEARPLGLPVQSNAGERHVIQAGPKGPGDAGLVEPKPEVGAADDKRPAAVRVQAAVGRPGPVPDPEARSFVARVQSAGAERVIQAGPRQERVEAAGLKSDVGPAEEKNPTFRIGAPPAAEPARHGTQNAVTERLIVPAVPGRQSPLQGPSPVVSEPVAAPRGVAEPEIPAVARQLTEAVMLQVRRLPAGTGQSLRVQIALEPPQLGRVTLRLTFGREGLEVRFYTPDRAVKEVIEQALPQLREALVRQEVNLGNTSVLLGQENPHQQSARLYRGPWTADFPPEEHAPETADDVHQEGGSRSGVDYLV